MIRSTVTVHDNFGQISKRVAALARASTLAGAEEAARVAQANASIDLEIELVAPHQDPDGVAAGIRSNKKGNRNTRIAPYFDAGTLGNRRKKLKRAGRSSWTVKRGGSSYTASRHDVTGKGIKPQRFFGKAKAAGRKAMIEKLHRGL
jgi:hypothetical protein